MHLTTPIERRYRQRTNQRLGGQYIRISGVVGGTFARQDGGDSTMGKRYYPWNLQGTPRKSFMYQTLHDSLTRLMGKRLHAVSLVNPCFITIAQVVRLPMILAALAAAPTSL